MSRTPWIGVDFDHTLRDDFDKPIPAMTNRVKSWLAQGMEVRIVTARMNPREYDVEEQEWYITGWCKRHIGTALKVQWGKSSGMIEQWDDKVVRVENGRRVSKSTVEGESGAISFCEECPSRIANCD